MKGRLTMTITASIQDVVQQKLTAFDRLQPAFEENFRFLQEVHGQKRFFSFSVAEVVHYLHARWICECKSRLLSVPRTVKEYEGRRCLELLWLWQEEEDTAAVVGFLQHKLDMQPFADLTRQLQEARRVHFDEGMVQRLAHGRQILLNRGLISCMHSMPFLRYPRMIYLPRSTTPAPTIITCLNNSKSRWLSWTRRSMPMCPIPHLPAATC